MKSPIKDFQVNEPQVGLEFTSVKSLIQHTQKHPLESRGEKWEVFLGQEALQQAREESPRGEAFRRISIAYKNFIDREVAVLVAENRGHSHWVRVGIVEDEFVLEEELCYAWSASARAFMVLGRIVRNAPQTAYRIITGYRVYLNGSEAQFEKKIQRDILNRVVAEAINCLEDHKEI